MTKAFVLFIAMMAIAGVGNATIITNTFDTPANLIGQTFGSAGLTAMGVTFQYTDGAGGSAKYGAIINTSSNGLTLLTDDVLNGSAPGTLTLLFAFPTSLLQFDAAVVPAFQKEQVLVTLSGPQFTGNPSQSLSTNDPNGNLFAEGAFSYSGSPITKAVINFDGGVSGYTLFAIDNLTYDASSPIPEPNSFLMLGSGILMLVALVCARQLRPSRAGRS